MKKLIFFTFLPILALVFSIQAHSMLPDSELERNAVLTPEHEAPVLDTDIFQEGADKYASWAYVGFVPRMDDPKRIQIVASKKGFSVRVSAQFTKDEISNYSRYLYEKFVAMEKVRNEDSCFPWERSIGNDQKKVFQHATRFGIKGASQRRYNKAYEDFNKFVFPAIDKGYETNLALLKQLFPGSVFVDNATQAVHFHMVFPMTPNKAGVGGIPRAGNYNIYASEERRTWYSKKGGSHIFGGFPTFWFNGHIGFHGPIRYSEPTDNAQIFAHADDDLLLTLREQNKISKKWQLVRRPNSAGCFRMEHTMTMRHMLPAEPSVNNLQKSISGGDGTRGVKVKVLNDFDLFDIDMDGKKELIGVKYYWTNPYTKPDKITSGRMEKEWKSVYYKSAPKGIELYELPYHSPDIVQIQAFDSAQGFRSTSYATMARLNRLPYGNFDLSTARCYNKIKEISL